jgi:hypothetical protein
VSTLEVLRAAREYISDPKRWHQGSFTNGAGAVCAAGACALAANGSVVLPYEGESGRAVRALTKAAFTLFDVTPEHVNDDIGYVEVLAMFDRAITIEEAKAAEFDATPERAPLVAA